MRTNAEKKTEHITVKCSKDFKETIEAYAAENRWSVSSAVHYLVEIGLKYKDQEKK